MNQSQSEKKAWLEEHGKFSKIWFASKAWMSHGGLIVESMEPDYIQDIHNKVKDKLFYRTNNPEDGLGY